MEEIKFLKGIWVKGNDSGKLNVSKGRTETLFTVSDIKRVCARKVYFSGEGTRSGIVVTCEGRLNWGDMNDFYFVTDSVEYVSKAINRPEEELNALILQQEIKEDK